MEDELIKIFDAEGKFTGVTSRKRAHTEGLWHETFHCWFISRADNKYFIHFQLRSLNKKDFPNQLDITAAGHLTSDETVEDGVREISEELGINMSLNNLTDIGKVPDEITQGNFIDREYCHVFLYMIPDDTELEYEFQVEEVSGVMKIELDIFEQLWSGKLENAKAEGIVINEDMKVVKTKKLVYKNNFVPHENTYISAVIEGIKNNFII